MSSWNDPERWRSLIDGSACPICVRGEPLDIVATLPTSWLTMPRRAPMMGYVCLVSRVHAVELHDLDDAQLVAFMADARRVARAVQQATGAVKLNYAMHGNVLPHLHMHLLPRQVGDPFEGRVIDPGATERTVYAPGAFETWQARIQQVMEDPT